MRLRKRAEFLRVQDDGARVHTPHFVFLISARTLGAGIRDGEPSARIGIVVSKKLGGAVVRNRVKRLCREAFRLNRRLFPIGADVVVIAKSGAEKLGLADVTNEWSRAAPGIAKKAAAKLVQS